MVTARTYGVSFATTRSQRLAEGVVLASVPCSAAIVLCLVLMLEGAECFDTRPRQ